MGRLGAIVLAAGGSTRLGRPKQLLRFRGTTLIEHAVANVRGAEAEEIVVVLGHAADECARVLPIGLKIALNKEWQRGLGTSLRLGANSFSHEVDRALIVLCDQPLISSSTLRQLIERMTRTNACACVSAYGGSYGPPVLISRSLIDRLKSWPDGSGAKAIWSDPTVFVEYVDSPEALPDIDTEADVSKILID